MKRSEMLQILEDAMDNNYDYAIDTGQTYDYDGIIEELENAGMLPPETPHDVPNSYGDFIPLNEWEPEEE